MKKHVLSFITASSLLLGMSSVNTTIFAATQDGWYKNGENWELYQNNQLTRNQWAKSSNTWYHFDENGSMQTGWLKENNHWYYLDKTGAMQTGWSKADYDGKEDWYYFDKSGAMQTGWIKDETNRWYYLRPDGVVHTRWYQEGNTWYYLGYNGDLKTGWYQVDGKWCYSLSNGALVTDKAVPASDGELYMIDKNGYMITQINGREFYRDANGDEYQILGGGRVLRGWYLRAHVTRTSVGYDLLFATFDFQKPNSDINPDNVVKNLQNFENRFYFGPDGKRVKTLPSPEKMSLDSAIEMRDGHPYLIDTTKQIVTGSLFTIVNQKLYYLNSRMTGELQTGYHIIIGSTASAGYNLLMYADNHGQVLYMRRLSDNYWDIEGHEFDGFFNDRLSYDGFKDTVTIVKS